MKNREKNTQPIRDDIFKKILADISYGKMRPGEKLSEPELVKRFGVSRTPVREALFQLEKEGFVYHKKDTGAFVKGIDSIQIAQLIDVMALLTGHATEVVVAGNIVEEDINHLYKLQKLMETKAKEKDYETYLDKNNEFHGFFVTRCGNEFLKRIIADQSKRLSLIRWSGYMTLPLRIEAYLQGHRTILEAVSLGDSSKARDSMTNHILDVKKFIAFDRIRNPEGL